MQITVNFDSLGELKTFAAEMAVGNGETLKVMEPKLEPVAPQTAYAAAPTAPIQQPAPVAPTTPVQQPVPVTSPPVHAPQPASSVPTSTATYTLDDIAGAAMTLMDSGRQNDLLGLLQSFGVEALPALPQSQYGAFATALRGLGAQI